MSTTTSRLCSFLTHRQPRHEGLDVVIFYSSPSKARTRTVSVRSSPKWLCIHFLLGSKTPCTALTGSVGFGFCGWLWYSCYRLSSGPAWGTFSTSSCSCDRFCDADPFSFGEDALWEQVLSEQGDSSVRELPQQRMVKGKHNALSRTPILHLQLCHRFSVCTPQILSSHLSSNLILWCCSTKS